MDIPYRTRVYFFFLFFSMKLKTKCTHRYMNYGTTTCTWIINEGCHTRVRCIFFFSKTIECICTQTSVHEQRTWKEIKKKKMKEKTYNWDRLELNWSDKCSSKIKSFNMPKMTLILKVYLNWHDILIEQIQLFILLHSFLN